MLLSAASISLQYGYDNTVSFDSGKVYTFDNLDFINSNIFNYIKDVVVNNDQLIFLTKQINLDNFLKTNLSAVNPDAILETSLLQNNLGEYWYLSNSVDPWTGSGISFTNNILSATVFNINFINQTTNVNVVSSNLLQIYSQVTDTNGDIVNLYLVNNPVSGYLSAGPTTNAVEDYTFYYILSGSAFSLFSLAGSQINNVIIADNTNNYLSYAVLSTSGPNNAVFPVESIFQTSRLTNTSDNSNAQFVGESTLIKYTPDNNNISVNDYTRQSVFNHLLTTAYKNISSTIPSGYSANLNINLLKNYYSPEFIQSAELDESYRSYNKIFTGLNQNDGYNNIFLSYNSSYINKQFVKDENNYFHYPYGTNVLPLTSEVEALINYGAYGDITPFRSDRIYKKLGSYKNYSSWGDSSGTLFPPATGTLPSLVQNGTYFCTWLSANADTDVSPVWVDRFYNPLKLGNSLSYSTSGILIASTNNNPNVIWDVPSQVTFEPGVLYNYFRKGDETNVSIVDSIPNFTYHINQWGDVLYNDITQLSAGNIINFTTANSAINNNVRDPYYIVDSSYGIVDTNDDVYTSDDGFTLAFFAYNDDWTTTKGNQIVGNYFNGGVGVFNNIPLLTPYITVCVINPNLTNKGFIQTYNTELELINYENITTLNTGTLSSHNFIVRSTYDKSYYVVDSYPNNYFLSVYDSDDLLVQKTPLSAGDSSIVTETITNVFLHLDLTTKEDFIIVQTRQSGSGCTYRKYTTSGALSGKTVNTTYNNFTLSTSGTPLYFQSNYVLDGNSIVSVVSGSNGIINEENTVFALSSTSFIRDASTTSLSAVVASIGKAEYVNCDQENNLWVAYNSKFLAKLNTNGNVIWAKQINTNDDISYIEGARVVNFLAEPSPFGINYYCLLLDGKSQTIYKIDYNGNVVKKIYVRGLAPGGDSTGFNIQRKYILPTVSVPGVSVKLVTKDTTLSSPTPNYVTLNCSTSAFSPGWHHFAVVYSSTDIAEFYVDGRLVSVNPLSGTYGSNPRVLYSIYNFKNNPNLTIGASNFKTNTLNQWLNQPDLLLYNGNIADVRIYNKSLNWSDIKAISKYYQYDQFIDLNWNSVTGTRSYIEEIQNFFIHRMPGSKSSFYNIRIKNSGVIDPSVRKIIENNILSTVTNVSPAYTRLRSIIWE